MKTARATTLVLSLAILAGAVLAQQRGIASLDKAAAPLRGFVYEIGKDNKPGLPGVDIHLRKADGSYLRRNKDTTNRDGFFEISLTVGQVEELQGGFIEFSKKPYRLDPEVREFMPKADLIEVGMWNVGQSPQSISRAISQIKALPAGEKRSALIASAAGLPPHERELARAALESSETQLLLAEFQKAEQATVLSKRIDAELLKKSFGGTVFTQANYPSFGKVYVGGSVGDNKELNDLKDLTRGFGVSETAVFIHSGRGISAKK
jgi:hypothetical protein